MNQNTGSKKDRNGGGDVTKSEQVQTPVVTKTNWDTLNQSGKAHINN